MRKDLPAAERLLTDSAERGSVLAMQELAELLTSGRCGMRRDAAAAAHWEARAAAADAERRRTRAPR